MNAMNKHKVGLALGLLFGFWHLVWVLLVAVGVAQSLLDWVFRLHFIQPVYVINPFSIGTAVVLVIFTSLVGYVLGWVVTAIWSRFPGCCERT